MSNQQISIGVLARKKLAVTQVRGGLTWSGMALALTVSTGVISHSTMGFHLVLGTWRL